MTRDRTLDVAVTGMAARLPGATDVDSWWSALQRGEVLTRWYSRAELLAAGVPTSVLDDPDYVPVHGHLDDADRFDHTVFRVSPREAEMMDPQHRLMLEVAWNALEDAGVDPQGGTYHTAVFASSTGSGYLRSMVANGTLDPLTLEDAIHGAEPDFAASRIAYKLRLTGQALAVQTACSSSLVAVHLAVQSLLNHECDQALVVGTGMKWPTGGYLHLPGGIQSPSGTCRPFDVRADGVVAGSGAACVVLRRWADVRADGVRPHGVILGSATNNDGSSKAGFYAPSVAGQEAAIRQALRAAAVAPDTVGYLELHGTGTALGDPIEWAAATAAYRATAGHRIAVGAVKGSVGHLDAAAGVTALIKALLVVRDGVVPPMAGFASLNPSLERDTPLWVPTRAQAWTGPQPRRGGVSAFGIGGTNAHVLVEAPPTPVPAPERPAVGSRSASRPPEVILLSAADPEALARSVHRLREHVRGHGTDVADVAVTLATGRAHLSERLALPAADAAELVERLASGRGTARGRCSPYGPPPLILLLPGQGTQFPGMALPLHAALPGFAAALDTCLGAFGPVQERLRHALLDPDSSAAELETTQLAQPALFALEYAAVTALGGLGLRPAALLGHSLGEITAACLAGVLDLGDAARFVGVRGRTMQDCPAGAMIALACAADEALELVRACGVQLELAAVNTPQSCVLGGPVAAVQELRTWLGGRIHASVLQTSRAFHTSLIAPAADRLADELAGTRLRPPSLPFASGATGRLVDRGTPIGPELFSDQARLPVRFADALAEAVRRFPEAVALEVGPGRALGGMAVAAGLRTVALLPPGAPDGYPVTSGAVRAALGELWACGQPVDVTAVCSQGRPTRLPGYPFAGPRWVAPEARAQEPRRARDGLDAAVPAQLGGQAATTVDGRTDAADAAAVPAVVVPGLWRDLLGHPEVDDEADFFALGGDSLLVTHLGRRIAEALGVRVPLRDLLVARTLGRQVELVTGLASAHRRTAGHAEVQDPSPLHTSAPRPAPLDPALRCS
jgi:acyl transferase domain-containing protein